MAGKDNVLDLGEASESENSGQFTADPTVPPEIAGDIRVCKKCGKKGYLRKGGCLNKDCESWHH